MGRIPDSKMGGSGGRRPVCLLSLDGGGIRGISSILILKEVMRQVNQGRSPDEHVQPWQVFDLIGGNSTGGIIAIMLGCLRMTLEECENAYMELAQEIFKPKRWKYNVVHRGMDFLSASERFDSVKLEELVKGIIQRRTGSKHAMLKETEEDQFCKVFVTTVRADRNQLTLLRSYENENERDEHSKDFQLWEALRATSAASTYFKQHRRGDIEYLDGAMGCNNPVFQVLHEARDLWSDRDALLISIGTGTKPVGPIGGDLIGLVRSLKILATETEETADNFARNHKSMVDDEMYFRFTVPGVGAVDLGAYKLIGKVRSETSRHLQNISTKKEVKACVRKIHEIQTKDYSLSLHIAEPPVPVLSKQTERDCLKVLHDAAGDYESHRLSIEARAPGTCEWVLKHDRFVQWRDDPSPSLLWVTANPGCGKSVLSNFLIDSLKVPFPDATICYFFFKGGDESRQSSNQAICALLHQVFKANPGSIQAAMEDYSNKSLNMFTQATEGLWKILCDASGRDDTRPIVCVIDALDECLPESRDRLVDLLVSTYSETKAAGKSFRQLKVVVTSRPSPNIEGRFHGLAHLRFRGEDESQALSADVERMIRFKVQELEKRSVLSAEAKSLVEKTLSARADQTFLWVSLVFDSISRLQSRSLSSISQSLDILPLDLDQLYEAALHRFVDGRATMKLLQIVLAARRPLKLDEINIAMSIKSGMQTLENLRRDLEPDAEYTIKQLGGFFIRIISSTVFLVHQTARDFLLGLSPATVCAEPMLRIDLHHANLRLAHSCIWFLVLKGFPKRAIAPTDEAARLISNKAFLANCPSWSQNFYQYAASSWAAHLENDSVFETVSDLTPYINRLCDSTQSLFYKWWFLYANKRFYYTRDHNGSGCAGRHYAHYSTIEGNSAITRGLVESKTCSFTETTSSGFDLLVAASCKGNVRQVRWILKLCEHHSLQLDNALQMAVLYRSISIAKLLITSGADVNGTSGYGSRSLLTMGETTLLNTQLLELLLDHGLIILDEYILIAAQRGLVDCLELLLDRDPRDMTERLSVLTQALSQAIEEGQPRSLMLLRKKFPGYLVDDADISIGLPAAAARLDSPSVQELLELGARDAGDALVHVSSLGHPGTVSALLSIQNYTDDQLDSALLAFFDMHMCPELTDYALTRVASSLVGEERPRVFECFRIVPSFGSSKEERTEFLEVLSSWGARISCQQFIQAAVVVIAMDEDFAMFLMKNVGLLQEDERLQMCDFLTAACFWGKELLVKTMLDAGADACKSDAAGVSPILAATASGNPAAVNLLYGRGASPTQRCRISGSQIGVLENVCSGMHPFWMKIAAFLESKDLEESALSLAQKLGFYDIVNIFSDVCSELL